MKQFNPMYSALLVLVCLSGCATVTKGKTDNVLVQISNCAESIPCEATNKKGSWQFQAPGPVTFKKSDQDLTIQCNDGPERLTFRITPTRGAMIWGNVLVGGIIGGGVDAATDAHWDVVEAVTLTRNYCYGQSVQQSYDAGAPAANAPQNPIPLRAVNEAAKSDCSFVETITRGAGGNSDASANTERAMNLALQQAAQAGADSYYVVKADTTATGASVIIEGLRCN